MQFFARVHDQLFFLSTSDGVRASGTVTQSKAEGGEVMCTCAERALSRFLSLALFSRSVALEMDVFHVRKFSHTSRKGLRERDNLESRTTGEKRSSQLRLQQVKKFVANVTASVQLFPALFWAADAKIASRGF